MGTTWKTAPTGAIPCFLCHRYLEPDKLEHGRCADRVVCLKVGARMVGRVKKISKRDRDRLGMD